MEHFHDHDIEEAVDSAVTNIVEQVIIGRLEDEQELTRQEAMDAIADCEGSDCAAIDLNLDQQLTVVEWCADDYGYDDMRLPLDSLRSQIESYATLFLQLLAESRTYGIFEELFDFMEEYDLEPDHMRESNSLGWLPHQAEREEGSSCTVYEYRNVEEPGNHIDVWEYRLDTGQRVWFESTPR